MEKASDIPDLAARIAETVRGVMLDLRPRLIEAASWSTRWTPANWLYVACSATRT